MNMRVPITDQEQQVIKLFYQDQLTERQIANQLNITISRVDQIKRRAIAKIKRGDKAPIPSTPLETINLGRLLS